MTLIEWIIMFYISATIFGAVYWLKYKNFIKTAKSVYKGLLNNKNWFGKFYTYIWIVLTLPSLVIAMIVYWLMCFVYLLYDLGIKKEV